MIKGVIKKIEVARDEDHTQEINPKHSVPALIPIEKLKLTSKCVCAQNVNKIITVRKLNNTRIFVNEVENSI
jgi:hypothetical protein